MVLDEVAAAMEVDPRDAEQNGDSTITAFLRDLADEVDNLDIETSEQFKLEKYEKAFEENATTYACRRRTNIYKPKKKLCSKMQDQSLSSSDQNQNDNSEGGICKVLDDSILEDESVLYNGMQYVKNKCYKYIDEEGEEWIVGIKHLLFDDKAYCVQLIEFDETVLEKVHNTSVPELSHSRRPKGISTYVQRGSSESIYLLSDLGDMADDIKEMPSCIYYERGEGRSALLFSLINASKNPTRKGLKKVAPVGLDCFSGAGLMSSGLEASGLNVNCAIEIEADMVQSYAKIHNAEVISQFVINDDDGDDDWKIIFKKDNKVVIHCTMKDFVHKCETDRAFKDALQYDFVTLSPPCQGFSLANRLLGGKFRENNEESLRILKVAELLKPKILLFENVSGLWVNTEKRNNIEMYLQPIVYGLYDAGYSVQVSKIFAADLGDPQMRPRLLIMASLSSIGLPLVPKPTHCSSKLDGSGLLPYVTVRDVLVNEEDNFPETGKCDDEELITHPDRPAPAVLASKSYYHYSQDRRYSLVENALLMGQERDFVSKLVGNSDSMQRQIGNGVPMEMAKALGRTIFEVLRWNWEEEEI